MKNKEIKKCGWNMVGLTLEELNEQDLGRDQDQDQSIDDYLEIAELNDKFRREVIQNSSGFDTEAEWTTSDGLKKRFVYSGIVFSSLFSSGIATEKMALRRFLSELKNYNCFNKDNDPHKEHDMGFIKKFKWFKKITKQISGRKGKDPIFGEVSIDSTKTTWEKQETDVWFKIDYYDLESIKKGKEFGSPNPADNKVTKRIMTIYLPEEH